MQKERYGLLGYPLGHSFSKRFFDKKFISENIEATFSNFELESVDEMLNEIPKIADLKGFTITIPHKESIIEHLTSIDPAAAEIGAVNCVKIYRDDKLGKQSLKGFNTDYIGFCNSISPLLTSEHKRALVLGTGGASKAVVYGLKSLGIESTIVSRVASDRAISYEMLTKEIVESHTVIVNTTPLGTYPKEDGYPNIPYNYLGASHLLYDLVYNPAVTKFLHLGETQGAKIKNGMDMLELQALEAWSIWTKY